MLDILAQMEYDFNEQENDARQEFEATREEIKNKNSEEYNVLRFTLEGLIEELERHFDSAHSQYMQATEQRTQDFKNLTIKDQDSAPRLRPRCAGCSGYRIRSHTGSRSSPRTPRSVRRGIAR